MGLPFVGEAGHLLDSLIEEAICEVLGDSPEDPRQGLRYAIMNILACIPNRSEEPGVIDIGPPVKTEAQACHPRLLRLIKYCNPKLIVTLGKPARQFFPKEDLPVPSPDTFRLVELVHPAHILRQPAKKQPILEERFTKRLAKAWKKEVS